MTEPYSPEGARVYIAPAVTTAPADAAAYTALTWTEIGSVESLGSYGDTAQELTATNLRNNRVKKVKGPRNAGTLAIVCTDDPADLGQQAAIAAERTRYNYPIKIVFDNAVTVGGDGEINYLTGPLMSREKNVGDSTNIVKRTFNVGINSDIIEVAAT
ncbi:iron ABC transporter substrate-binding protein [Methylosinus sporium]|uniref:Iron ABC transporter substrate-binding protein n=1 Tax=Methylosinus sporium TaxID=428 RepID=A0A2U1SSQ6_METSR|nr:iron ABC transporter substrate-binding protein [Methylosinus sporium]PWB94658.1 iron ABC transporter substrate-binding protein [Methylosinus sporium]